MNVCKENSSVEKQLRKRVGQASLPCACVISTQRVSLADSPPSLPHWLHTPAEPKDCWARSESQPIGQHPGEWWVLRQRLPGRKGPGSSPIYLKAHLHNGDLKDIFYDLVNFIFGSSFRSPAKGSGKYRVPTYSRPSTRASSPSSQWYIYYNWWTCMDTSSSPQSHRLH